MAQENLSVWSKILPFKTTYEEEFPLINPSYAKNQKQILELVDYYWMNKFKDGDRDTLGFKKAFYNIVMNPTEVSQKFIDFDTKDVRIIAEDGQSYCSIYLIRPLNCRKYPRTESECVTEDTCGFRFE